MTAAPAPAPPPPLTIVVTNARIATGDPQRPWVTALGVAGDALAALGPAAEILKRIAPATRVVDAGGATIGLPDGAAIGSRVRVVTEGDTVRVLVPPDHDS